jgi:hypothetical protein
LRRARPTASTFPPTATISRAFVRQLPAAEPLTVIGLGSNLLVRDGGVRGTIIVTHAALDTLELVDGLIHAEAGVTSPKVARFAATHGLDGAEFLAGIPGTWRSARDERRLLRRRDWRHVARVEVVTRSGACPPSSRLPLMRSDIAACAAPTAACRPRCSRGMVLVCAGRWSRCARADRRAAAPADRDAAAQPSERGQRLPQSLPAITPRA